MKMYFKLIVFIFLSVTPYLLIAQKNETITISYLKPYEYVAKDNNLLIKAQLSIQDQNTFSDIIFENGMSVGIEYKDGNAWAWLPLIGLPQEMDFIAKKKNLNRKQLFTPLVTSDWGYFQQGTFHIISSSHQDIGWMDTPDVCRHDRIYEIILPALDMMKTDDDYHFVMEQALNLKEFIEEFPNRKDEIVQRYKEGRFNWGATYNQPYEGMAYGEQLVRQVYFGKLWIEKNFQGAQEITAYNTDVPSRAIQFPQILAKSGVENLFVSRMREGFYNWHSPDGSSVLTYTPGNYGWAAIFYKLFDEDAIEALHKIQNRVKMWSDYYKKHNLPPHFAIVISNDASGPVNYGHVIKEWNQIIEKTGAKIPILRHSTVTGFLAEINQPAIQLEYLEGSLPNLWGYIHGPGHHKAITASRKSGRFLPSAEIFATADALINKSFSQYPADDLSKAFEASIYPDHGWGGKNGEITDSIFRASLEFAAAEAERLLDHSLNEIAKKVHTKNDNAIVVFNDLSWKRNGLAAVNIKNAKSYYVVDEKGLEIASQVSVSDPDLLQFYVVDIPSLGYKTFYLKKGKGAFNVDKKVVPNALTNQFYSLHLNQGGITYLYDRSLGKEVLNTTRFSGGDILHMGYDGNGAGEFTVMTKPNMNDYDKSSNHKSFWKVSEDGSIFTEFENRIRFKHTQVVQRIRVYHLEKKIDFFVDLLDWNGTYNRQFRFAVPLDMHESKIKYEVPYAIEEVGKSEMKNAPGGWAWGGTYDQKPVTIHPREVLNYISAETKNFAVTLSTDVALADWIDPTREAVDYTVLQGILLSSHKSCHGEGNWYHQAGNHHFRFSLTSHVPNDQFSYQFGASSNHPLRVVFRQNRNSSGTLPGEMSFFSVSDPMVRISTIKKSEEGENVIVRLAEMEGKNKQINLIMPVPFHEIIKTNMIEQENDNLRLEGEKFNIEIGNNAIDTYKMVIKRD